MKRSTTGTCTQINKCTYSLEACTAEKTSAYIYIFSVVSKILSIRVPNSQEERAIL